MMHKPRLLALIICLTLLFSSVACAEEPSAKEETIYGLMDASGAVMSLYAVNSLPAGMVTDWGDYSAVLLLSGEETLRYTNGYVYVPSAKEPLIYQGDMTSRQLPWQLTLTWLLEGVPVSPRRMAGSSGRMALQLAVARNPDVAGPYFDDFSLTITAQLDTTLCRNIQAEGASSTLVGHMQQFTWTLLPGTETVIELTAYVTDFSMPGLLIEAALPEESDTAMDTAAVTTEAAAFLQPSLDQANATLEDARPGFDRLSIDLPLLTAENYNDQVASLQQSLLDAADEDLLRLADAQSTNSQPVLTSEEQSALRRKIQAQVYSAVESQVRAAVQQEVRSQLEQSIVLPDVGTLEAMVDQQMASAEVQAQIDQETQNQMQSEIVQAEIDRQLTAAIRPQVEAAVRPEVRAQVETAMQATLREGVVAAMEVQFGSEIASEMLQSQPATSTDLSTAITEIEAAVAARMALPETQQQIDALTASAMEAQETQLLIDAQTDQQMSSDEVQAVIDAQTAQQAANPAYRAQAEAAVQAEVRSQVEAAVRAQVRAAILSEMAGMDASALVEAQMQTEAVQQQINAAVSAQMQTEKIQQQIDSETNRQLSSLSASAGAASSEDVDRSSADYLSRLAGLIRSSGKDASPWEALADVRLRLDAAMALFNALADDSDTLSADDTGIPSFVSDQNGAIASVRFILSTPALEAEADHSAEAPDDGEETFWERLMNLFR